MNYSRLLSTLTCAALVAVAGCQSTPHSPVAGLPPPQLSDAQPRNYPGLHNVVAYHPDFFSGSVPEGEAGFETLERLGVKTIITVDGATPDIDAARAHGIRYIHLPFGYNGFQDERGRELARATRDSLKDGPVYIHCHHGKHRSAGAAGTIAVELGWMSNTQAVDRMKVSGTSPAYKGLYQCASEAHALSGSEIDAVPANFPAVAPPRGMVKSMVEIDDASEHLKAIEKAGWKTPADHPDLVPAAEAGHMADLLRNLQNNQRVLEKPQEFQSMLKNSQERVQKLEDMLAVRDVDSEKLSAQFKLVSASCTTCHAAYRDPSVRAVSIAVPAR